LATGQHKAVDKGRALKPVEESLTRLGGQRLSSADRVREGVEGRKLGAGSGGGGSLKSAQIGSVVQCLTAAATESASRNWAEECEAGEAVNKGLDRPPSHASVSKVKQKGKAPQSSK